MPGPNRDQTFRVLRAQAGDRQALDELLLSVQKPLFGYIRGLVGNRQLAEDVLQDVLVLICRKLRWLREPALFRSWAYRIASRRALRVLEGERRRAGVATPAEEEERAAAPPAYDPALVASLPRFLAEISPRSRTVLSLHYLQEMSLQETADVLDIPLGTAKSRLGYGLEALRRLLNSKNPSR
ncbi:MAG: RNA polymerase sigma factor [Acidobacteriota bacterium]